MSKDLTQIPNHQFDEIISIIDNARNRALKAVNAELIQMYWNVGEYLSDLCAKAGFGDKVIGEVAAYIADANPGVKGFNRRGLYRIKQFYETYKDDEFVTPLVTQIRWTNHLLIMSSSKSTEKRHFYMTLCAKERYSKRELERQMDSAYWYDKFFDTSLSRFTLLVMIFTVELNCFVHIIFIISHLQYSGNRCILFHLKMPNLL